MAVAADFDVVLVEERCSATCPWKESRGMIGQKAKNRARGGHTFAEYFSFRLSYLSSLSQARILLSKGKKGLVSSSTLYASWLGVPVCKGLVGYVFILELASSS